MTTEHEPVTKPPTRGREVGSQIAGVFGAVFVFVNSGGLPPIARVSLLVAAGLAVAAIFILSFASYRALAGKSGEPSADSTVVAGHRGSPFGRKYWLIVGIEAIALFGGARLISGLGYPELGVAWVAFVVGTHFFALAQIFGLVRFHVLGGIITALGIAGFVLRIVDQMAAISIVSGVVTGFVLLGFGLGAYAKTQGRLD